MPKSTARVTTEIEAQVSLDAFDDDLNPEENYLDNFELGDLWMFGREWSERDLRITFGDMGADALIGLIFGLVEDYEHDD
jgi:hypothetical protein